MCDLPALRSLQSSDGAADGAAAHLTWADYQHSGKYLMTPEEKRKLLKDRRWVCADRAAEGVHLFSLSWDLLIRKKKYHFTQPEPAELWSFSSDNQKQAELRPVPPPSTQTSALCLSDKSETLSLNFIKPQKHSKFH